MLTLAQRLQEAEVAYHDLMSGAAVAEVRDQNGEMIRYQPANAFRLAAYIEDLKRQLGRGSNAGPMRIWGR